MFSKGVLAGVLVPLHGRHGLDSMDLNQRTANMRCLGMRVGNFLCNNLVSINGCFDLLSHRLLKCQLCCVFLSYYLVITIIPAPGKDLSLCLSHPSPRTIYREPT